MKRNIRERLGKERLICDGGMGSLLSERGLLPGEATEAANLRMPEVVRDIHKSYIAAGADIINTNTFGVNSLKYDNYRELVEAAVEIAKSAAQDTDAYVALDVGPLGRMLKPLGDLGFEDAVSVFKDTISLAEPLGCDLVFIETMTDLYEAKAALLAAKEVTSLPVFVTCAFDASGKLMTGASPEAVVATLEAMGADAVGLNCSMGPAEALSVLERILAVASIPVIINPNAGIPESKEGKTVYNVDADEFAEYIGKAAEMGASLVGGCCGTTPEYIAAVKAKCKGILYTPPTFKDITVVSSYTNALVIGDRPVAIGERINPTGKAKLKAALREGNISYLLHEALLQVDEGADALDVNFGLPELDEADMMRRMIPELQAVTDLPLQIDSGNPAALEAAMRVYNGKPFVNSVSGKEESLVAVLPLVKKYGGVLIALLIDESGIPETADARLMVADKILARAKEYGIDKRDIIFDPLCLTIASGDNNANVTLECVKRLSARGLKTSLGISNISFGLPEREVINSTFYALALGAGLSAAILNPHSPTMMNTHRAFIALAGKDTGAKEYCERVIKIGEAVDTAKAVKSPAEATTLKSAVIRGLSADAARLAGELVPISAPTEIINSEIIPALNEVGEGFEQKRVYLPQLLMSAEAASAAFAVIKESVKSGADNGHSIVLATVKGDIHDIGKNIVKLLFESYGYRVIDLGRDVDSARIVSALRESGAELVGLSALMTTTVGAMEETIKAVRKELPKVKIIVGGAVLTEDYATAIGADYYASDAMSGVRIANSALGIG